MITLFKLLSFNQKIKNKAQARFPRNGVAPFFASKIRNQIEIMKIGNHARDQSKDDRGSQETLAAVPKGL